MFTPSLSARIIDTTEDVDVLCNILDDLNNISVSSNLPPSLKKYWLLSFVRTYGSSRNLAITVIFEDGFPKLVMPLQLKGSVSLEFLCDETSDYNDFFYGKVDIDLVKYALEYWSSKGIRKISLDRLPPDSKTIELLTVISAEMNWELKIDKCDSLPVVIAQPEKEIQDWDGVKRHAIKRYERKLKALNNIANTSFSFIETTSQLTDLFPEIRRMHIARWKLSGVQSKYIDPKRDTFIINICTEALKENTLFFPIMKINNILASYIIGFKSGNTIYDWNTSFSVDYFKWSPGALLLLHILSNCKMLGYSRYNFMKGLESHKFIWTNVIEDNLSLKINL